MIKYFIFIIISLTIFTKSLDSPTKFGLLTVTHERSVGNQYFKKYLSRYAEMECDIIQQIAIVWNNNYTVADSNLLNLKDKWKRPVYFYKTQYDAMAFRFQLPLESISEVFYVLDDDIQISCQELNNGFNQWKSHSFGNIGPLAGYVKRSLNFDTSLQKFEYFPTYSQYYSLILVGATFIPRNFLTLFNSQTPEALKMIQHVKKIRNCDDLMMNFLVTKYYPTLLPTFIDKKSTFILTDGPNAVSKRIDHFTIRNECLKVFSQIIGQIPMHIFKNNFKQIKTKLWEYPLEFQQKIAHLYDKAVIQSFKQYNNNRLLQQNKTQIIQSLINKAIEKQNKNSVNLQKQFLQKQEKYIFLSSQLQLQYVVIQILFVLIIVVYSKIFCNLSIKQQLQRIRWTDRQN